MTSKTICRWLLLVVGLEEPKKDQTVYCGQLLLVPSLEPLSKKYMACLDQMPLVWGL